MRLPLKICLVIGAIALATLVGSIISRLLFFKSIFFQHAGIALTQPQVAAAASTPNDARTQHIPKIIHQIYHNWHQPGNDTLPSHWATVRQQCVDLNPDFEFRVRRAPVLRLPTRLLLTLGRSSSGPRRPREISSKPNTPGSYRPMTATSIRCSAWTQPGTF